MNEDQASKGLNAVIVTVAMLCEKLTNDEMAGIGLRLSLGQSLRGISSQEKIRPLLDERGGMHDITQNAFWHVYQERFPEALE